MIVLFALGPVCIGREMVRTLSAVSELAAHLESRWPEAGSRCTFCTITLQGNTSWATGQRSLHQHWLGERRTLLGDADGGGGGAGARGPAQPGARGGRGGARGRWQIRRRAWAGARGRRAAHAQQPAHHLPHLPAGAEAGPAAALPAGAHAAQWPAGQLEFSFRFGNELVRIYCGIPILRSACSGCWAVRSFLWLQPRAVCMAR